MIMHLQDIFLPFLCRIVCRKMASAQKKQSVHTFVAFCQDCNKKFTTEAQQEIHLKGKKHQQVIRLISRTVCVHFLPLLQMTHLL